MTDGLIAKADKGDFGNLFRVDLFWHSPDQAPIEIEFDDGSKVKATNVSSFKGVRVWEVPVLPGSAAEAKLDQAIAKKSTNRLVIFHDGDKQVWRWPSRTAKGAGVISRPARHVHRAGSADPKFVAKLDAIRLPSDVVLDVNDLLSRVRGAFDVETKNETKRASKLMAQMYAAVDKGYPPDSDPKKRDHEISVSLARVLFLLFGDDTEMWKDTGGEPLPDLFQDFVKDHTERDGSDIAERFNTLFEVLDTAPKDRSGLAPELAAFPYVNGGIFGEHITLPHLDKDFRAAILAASAVDWSTISPAIFGSMFQSVRDAHTRRELGEHYTSEENILKTLNPLFLDELRAEFQHILTLQKGQRQKLHDLWKRLGDIRYMDPACGCGNFIIVAYRELRDLELRIMDALATLTDGEQTVALPADWTHLLKVTLDHFYGIEIDEWPARIAETAMFLIDRQCDLRMKERFGVAPERLPIQRQSHIEVCNALQVPWRDVLAPTEQTVIAGNPPFLGKTERTSAQTADMQHAWGSAYSGEADFVTSWFARAADYFGAISGRWAFVSTNSVCQGAVVAPVFGHLADGGWRVRFAHRTFEWTSDAAGAAAVHCVIIGMDKRPRGSRRLFHYQTVKSEPREFDVDRINAYLVDGPEVLVRDRRRALVPELDTDIRFGSMPADGGGLLVSALEYAEIRDVDPIAVRYLRRFVGAKELLNNKERWCIWMPDGPGPDVAQSPFLTDRIATVLDFRAHTAKDAGVRAASATPHRFNRVQQPESDYLCIPRHVPESYEYFPAAHFGPEVISGDANFVLTDPDGFFFAVLSSRMFMAWQKTVGGRIKNDPRFASTVTWNTFPLPRTTSAMRQSLADRAKEVLVRRLEEPNRSLAEQYEPNKMSSSLVAAHDDLDEAVYEAFGLQTEPTSELELQEVMFKHYAKLDAGIFAESVKTERKRQRT